MALTSEALALSKHLARPTGPVVPRSQITTLAQARNYALAAAWATVALISRYGVLPELELALTQYQRAAWTAGSPLSTSRDVPGIVGVIGAADALVDQGVARARGGGTQASSTSSTNVVPIRGAGTVIYGDAAPATTPPKKRSTVGWWIAGALGLATAIALSSKSHRRAASVAGFSSVIGNR